MRDKILSCYRKKKEKQTPTWNTEANRKVYSSYKCYRDVALSEVMSEKDET